jgi:hypothetical protein
MTEQDPKNYWLELMDHQAESGLAISAFCQKHEISRHRFYYWRKRLGKNKKSNGFFKLIPSEDTGNKIKIYLSEPPCIEVEPGFDPQTLQSIVKTLGGYLCSA